MTMIIAVSMAATSWITVAEKTPEFYSWTDVVSSKETVSKLTKPASTEGAGIRGVLRE